MASNLPHHFIIKLGDIPDSESHQGNSQPVPKIVPEWDRLRMEAYERLQLARQEMFDYDSVHEL